MPETSLPRFLNLQELKIKGLSSNKQTIYYHMEKIRIFEFCPKCATKSTTIYDKRIVNIKDHPVLGKSIIMKIEKRRYYCKTCKKPFTECIQGIRKGARTTERFKRGLLWACENFSDLKKVLKAFNCSSGYLYKALYNQLELERKRTELKHWPKTIGIDEHGFRKNKKGFREFVTIIPSYNHKRLVEVVFGKTSSELMAALKHIQGREKVCNVVLDLSDPYKSFVKTFFTNANIIADKFHVLRLLTPAINKKRKEIAGDRRKNPIGRLLLKNAFNLDYYQKKAINLWLLDHPELSEIYYYKEALHKIYRCNGFNKAKRALINLLDHMSFSKIKEIQTLRRTLIKWQNEILNYFKFKITNARTEAYNNVAKLVQKRAFGFRSFKNYRLRLLHACSY